MKKSFAFILIFLSIIIFAQKGIVDTAQVVIQNRFNNAEAMQKPYVIMISTDGFRSDYTKKYNAENLLKYSNAGVQAKAMIPSYPSITFPNHWTLITGLYPSQHG